MSLSGHLESLFPQKWSIYIFIAYMALFINQGILVTASKNRDNSFSYNSVTVVLLVEVTKLFSASTIFLSKHEWKVKTLVTDFVAQRTLLLYYMVPAGLYCAYNVLTFTNLAAFDPTTYFLLLQLRVVVTGILFQVLFKKRLTAQQWGSLLLLTAGCVIKQLDSALSDSGHPWYQDIFSFNIVLMLVQVFCSCFAGVYNEYLLKHKAAGVDIMLQNMYMYSNSMVLAVVTLAVRGELADAVTPAAGRTVLQPVVLAIIANNAAIGIVTSVFLQKLNSILKTFASALELLFTALLCWLIFGIAVHASTLVSIGVVSAAVWLYSRQPVHNPAPADLESARRSAESSTA